MVEVMLKEKKTIKETPFTVDNKKYIIVSKKPIPVEMLKPPEIKEGMSPKEIKEAHRNFMTELMKNKEYGVEIYRVVKGERKLIEEPKSDVVTNAGFRLARKVQLMGEIKGMFGEVVPTKKKEV